jgi:hypothetical protein
MRADPQLCCRLIPVISWAYAGTSLGAPIDPGDGVAHRQTFGMHLQTYRGMDGTTSYGTKALAEPTR